MYTLNCGMNYQGAGPLNLVGGSMSYRTELPEDIKTFEQFKVPVHSNGSHCVFAQGDFVTNL